jgi:two-component system, NarL family, invasion response regulator UvrY
MAESVRCRRDSAESGKEEIQVSPQADSPVRVLTVDDHAGFRTVMREVVSATPGFTAVGDAPGGADALEAIHRLRPGLVIVDVRMPGMSGFELARRIRGAYPDTVVLLVSSHDLFEGAATARACGACAFIRKEEIRPAKLRGLWRVHG